MHVHLFGAFFADAFHFVCIFPVNVLLTLNETSNSRCFVLSKTLCGMDGQRVLTFKACSD